MQSTASVILFIAHAPSSLAHDLTQAGFGVFEALAISEVLYLCETERIDIVVIAAEIQEQRAKEIKAHQIILHLKPAASSREIIAELWRVLPHKAATIQ